MAIALNYDSNKFRKIYIHEAEIILLLKHSSKIRFQTYVWKGNYIWSLCLRISKGIHLGKSKLP